MFVVARRAVEHGERDEYERGGANANERGRKDTPSPAVRGVKQRFEQSAACSRRVNGL